MLYTALLKSQKNCPFCEEDDCWFLKNRLAGLTFSLAPYVAYHLLVVPKRHVKDYSELTRKELTAVFDLLDVGIEILRAKKIRNYSILVRNGNHDGKSVGHLHFHLIPKHVVGDMELGAADRVILTEKQIKRLRKSVETILQKQR